ncbi:hypothetical protein OB962_03430 [Aeromonas piscicola]|uniref:Uncharacterized protein n=1 Tax=Aeromonas piscicola TaxID=600645 RepID=A0ABT7Q7Y8_9GAMM|nr:MULTISPECIES: hypothetical protein [Aeromonas]MDM5130056.1 hypothetical protein [Aeromonas piscicola]WFC15399.1 hypothetical protein L3V47_06525 [Aeromonas salmonicida]
MPDFDNRLAEFFHEPRNSSRRESLLLNRMSYDFQLAAATSGYYLKIYNSDVDDNGYDVIVDSEMVTKKLQVKSLLSTSKTKSWAISKGLIKPDSEEICLLVDWTNIHPPGIGGGVVLQEVKLNEFDINIQYHYSDIWIITLYSRGIIGSDRHQKIARKFIHSLLSGNYHDKINIAKSLFVKVKSPASLLSLMCIHTNYRISNIRYLLSERHSGKLSPPEQIDILINDEIKRLCIPD